MNEGPVVVLLLLEAATILLLLRERRRRTRTEVEARRWISQLAHVNRRSTVGELSASIAHELSQPLSAILRNTEAAELMLGTSCPDLAYLGEILGDIKRDEHRASEVIRRLRRLLTNAPFDTQEIDLNDVVREVFELLSGQASAGHVTLSTRLDPQAPCVTGDRIQLQQVILNLVMNGIEAIEGSASAERGIIGRTAVLNDTSMQVSIEDSGPGVPPDTLNRMFEPFFTTKEAGMGMGLSIARMIVERHGGNIWAENRRAGGAVFRFNLPLARGGRAGTDRCHSPRGACTDLPDSLSALQQPLVCRESRLKPMLSNRGGWHHPIFRRAS
jgi:C4-dicarboxylate-specific signal transduction histidine kinase